MCVLDSGVRQLNWDTNELFLWLVNTEQYYNTMIDHCRTAKEFKRFASFRLNWINNEIGNEEAWIDANEIQWNEIYLRFCDLVGNENPKMNLDQK